MAREHRIRDENEGYLNFTCRNVGFETDIHHLKGKHHGSSRRAKGSVFASPLKDWGAVSLWLEYVRDRRHPDREWYWLMWYNKDGRPTIPMSGVFSGADLAKTIGRLAKEFLD